MGVDIVLAGSISIESSGNVGQVRVDRSFPGVDSDPDGRSDEVFDPSRHHVDELVHPSVGGIKGVAIVVRV